MTGHPHPPAAHRLLTPLQIAWLVALLIFTLGGLLVLVRDARRIDQVLGSVAQERLYMVGDLANLQREMLRTDVELLRFSQEGADLGRVTNHYAFAKGYFRNLISRTRESRGVLFRDAEVPRRLLELERQVAQSDELIAAYQAAESPEQRAALTLELDAQLGEIEETIKRIFFKQEVVQKEVIEEARLIANESRLSLSLVGAILAMTTASLLFVTQQMLRTEQQANHRFLLAASAVNGAIYDWDIPKAHLLWTEGLTETFGHPLEEITTTAEWWMSQIHPEDLPQVMSHLEDDIRHGRDFVHEYRFRTKEGSYLEVWDRGRVGRNGTGQAIRMVGSMVDITERKQAEQALRESERKYAELVQEAPDAIISLDRDGNIASFNPTAERMFGHSAEAVLGTKFAKQSLIALPYLPKLLQEVEMTLTRKERPPFELQIVRNDNHLLMMEANPRRIQRDGQVVGVQLTLRDISERKAFEEQLAQRVFYDALTGLPNRALFRDRVDRALARSSRNKSSIAVLFLDLDRFKVINDSLGHSAGDQLLVQVARRLQSCVRPEDTVARLGGDEFTVLLEEVSTITDAVHVADRIARALRIPFILEERELFSTVSVGIVLNGPEHSRPDDLLRDADVAMYRAKARGKAQYEVFDTSMNAQALERLELETALRQAIDRKEFLIYYQPLFCLCPEGGERIVGLEALVRWQHPRWGLIQPDTFIPLAEETGLIVNLGQWVLTQACRQMQHWQRRYPMASPLAISVNLSARQFQQPQLVNMVSQVLQYSGLPPGSLKLEITESVLVEDAILTSETLRRLKELGVLLAIDDFGVGYSSLSYLKHFPVDSLKIDRSFIRGLGAEQGDTAIVLAVVTLARSLSLQVVAEGVESVQQLTMLRELGCEVVQGYYFARALPVGEVDPLLAEQYRKEQ
ncbi:MAG: EAL domain-containing protein [Ardenticatenales bacterium]|nr:EAL domain-containing protein [Ardenticatenales bacterium]